MTEREKQWLEFCRQNKDRYVITVDNDAVFVTDLNSQECVFEFRHFGWEMVLDLICYIGCNAEGA